MTPDECAVLYYLLAVSFTCPDTGFADRLTRLVGELRLESWDSDATGRPILPITPFIRVLATMDQPALDQVQHECHRLFAGGSPDALCPVHAWAYRPETKAEILVQAAQDMYTAWGRTAPQARATHIGTELEFLAYLCRHSDDEAAQRARQEFLYKHALVWLLRFSAAVMKATRLNYYQATAQLLTDFLKLEAHHLFGRI